MDWKDITSASGTGSLEIIPPHPEKVEKQRREQLKFEALLDRQAKERAVLKEELERTLESRAWDAATKEYLETWPLPTVSSCQRWFKFDPVGHFYSGVNK